MTYALGVLLLVALTVLLAGIVAQVVFGVVIVSSEPAPSAKISFAFDTGAETVTLSHEGGQSFAASSVRLVGPAGELNDLDDWGGGDGRVTGGEQFTVDLSGPPGVVGGDTIRVVWTGQGEFSATIARAVVPSA